MTATTETPRTPREQQFMDDVEVFRARGGSTDAVIAMMHAIESSDRANAFQLLLDVTVNPVDRELFQAGLSIIQGSDA